MKKDPYGEAILECIADGFNRGLNMILGAYLAPDGVHLLINPMVTLEDEAIRVLKLTRDVLDMAIESVEVRS